MNDIAILAENLSKVYKLYDKSIDRLKESINPLRKKYHKDFYALSDISFEVKKGETVGIIGKNGSGKSTLLKIITGVLTPSTGNVIVNGKVSALLELGSGFNLEYTGVENIYLNGSILGYSKEEIDQRVNDIISFAEIGDFAYQPVKIYSSGMFVRLGFAVAIHVDPEILIIDEALAVGDYKFQAKCYKKIDEFRNRNKTILLVTHDADSVRKFCNKAIWINEGKIIEYGDVNNVTSKYLEFLNDQQIGTSNKSELMDIATSSSNINIINKITNFSPINRWGRLIGIIRYIAMYNSINQEMYQFETGERISLEVIVDLQKVDDIDNVSIAFSLKNKSGTDIIVSTTYDYDIKITDKKIICVKYDFNIYLVPGEYTLVVAVEDRLNKFPEYYDYIEGAAYIKMFSQKNHHGLLSIPTDISIIEYDNMKG